LFLLKLKNGLLTYRTAPLMLQIASFVFAVHLSSGVPLYGSSNTSAENGTQHCKSGHLKKTLSGK
jgi:hypothetical protein